MKSYSNFHFISIYNRVFVPPMKGLDFCDLAFLTNSHKIKDHLQYLLQTDYIRIIGCMGVFQLQKATSDNYGSSVHGPRNY